MQTFIGIVVRVCIYPAQPNRVQTFVKILKVIILRYLLMYFKVMPNKLFINQVREMYFFYDHGLSMIKSAFSQDKLQFSGRIIFDPLWVDSASPPFHNKTVE